MNSRILGNEDVSLNYFKIAQDWLEWRNNQKDDSEVYRKCPISYVDIANEAEVILRLKGVEKCLSALNRWTPVEARIQASELLFENVIRYSNPDRISEWLEYSKFNMFEKLILACNLFKFANAFTFDTNEMAREILLFLSRPKLKLRLILHEYVLQFCRILALNSIDKSLILEILSRIDIIILERIPSFYKGYHDENLLHFKNNLSKVALVHSIKQTEIKIEDFYPTKFINSEQIKDYKKGQAIREEKNEFDIFYRHLIPIYALISDIYVGGTEHSAYYKRLQVLIKNLNDDYRFDHHVGYRSSDRKLFLIERYTEVAVHLENKEEAVSYVCEAFVSQNNIMQIRFAILDIIVNHVDLNPISMRVLKEQDVLIKASNMSSQQLIESYSDCLTTSSKIDDEFSHYFLEQILHAANEVDMEAFDKINCIASLSEVGSSSPNPKLAFEYARFIEYSDVKLEGYEKENFPYIAGLKGIANFDKSSVLPTMCRFHHRNIIKINQRITPILIHLLKIEYLDHVIVSSLLPIISYYPKEIGELYKIVCSKFDENADSINKTKFVKSEFRNLRLDRDNNGITNLYESIKSGSFIERKLLKEIKNYLEFQNQLTGNYTDSRPRIIEKDDFSHGLDLTNFDYTTTDDLEKAIREIIVLHTTDHRFRFYVEDFLINVISLLQPDQYLPFLNALIEIDIELLDFYTLEKVLEKVLTDWDYYPSLKVWKRDNFKHILSTRFDHFNAHYGFLVGSLKEFAILFDIDDVFLAECIYEILPKKLDLLTDESIYALTNLIKSKLTAESNENFITWVLDRWNANIPIDFADGVWDQKVKSPENPDENVANFIRFLLGHPDKSLRWRSMHSLRRMVNQGNVNTLNILLDKQNTLDCLPFQNKAYMFYWMSAKLYLWIAIDRISLENPMLLASFKDGFLKELINEDLPHVLIRHFIKKSCLNLLSFDNSIYTEEEIQRINAVNISKKGYKERDRDRKRNTERDELVFNFDSMDTLPYWYDPLGRLFDLSSHDVAVIADTHISEKWGYVGNPRDDDYIKDQLDDKTWYSTQNRHGSIPDIEDLQRYFEYHAMYIAANTLLENYPLLENDYESDGWEYWLNSEANKFANYWVSELRDPIPLRTDLWKNDILAFDETWRDIIEDHTFEDYVGLSDDKENSIIVVYGDIDKNIGKVTERIDISSCLVSNKDGDKILQKLKDIKNHYHYYFPLESEEHVGNSRIKGCTIEPWIKGVDNHFTGLDTHDPFWGNAAKWSITLGDRINDSYGIIYDNLYKQGKLNDVDICWFENWNEISEDSYRHREYSNTLETSGKLLKVSIKFILQLLKSEGKSLLIRCIINRELGDDKDLLDYNKGNIDNRNQVKLYLVKED